jgi:hypothetical protein
MKISIEVERDNMRGYVSLMKYVKEAADFEVPVFVTIISGESFIPLISALMQQFPLTLRFASEYSQRDPHLEADVPEQVFNLINDIGNLSHSGEIPQQEVDRLLKNPTFENIRSFINAWAVLHPLGRETS